MNAPPRSLVNALGGAMAARLATCGGAAALLAGCMGPFAVGEVDPRSPIAAEVARTARANRDYPSFAEIPAPPADLRPVRMYGAQAAELEAERAQLERETAPDTWTLRNTDAFAARARADAGPDAPPPQTADTEAFAESVRRRATPPPPPKR